MGVFAVLSLFLAACGFHPLYGTDVGSGTSPELEGIAIAKVSPSPENRNAVGEISSNLPRSAQLLQNDLLDRLTPRGKPAHPRYSLTVVLNEGKQNIVITQQSEVTRSSLVMSATYTLTDFRTGARLHENSARAIASFDVLRASFGNVAAERDARERLARELSELIRIELASWFARPAVSGS